MASEIHSGGSEHPAASALLKELCDSAPVNHFTLNGMLERIPNQSFALVLLLLAIATLVPGVGILATLLIMICACQMMMGRSAPLFPRWIAERPLPTRGIGKVVRPAVKALQFLERGIHPRFPTSPEATKRVVGGAVLLLSVRLFLSTVPFNFPPTFAIALMSIAYLERDGLLLAISFLAAFAILATDLALLTEILRIGRAH
jgi:hypothetical protein